MPEQMTGRTGTNPVLAIERSTRTRPVLEGTLNQTGIWSPRDARPCPVRVPEVPVVWLAQESVGCVP